MTIMKLKRTVQFTVRLTAEKEQYRYIESQPVTFTIQPLYMKLMKAIFIETEESGKPVLGMGEIRSGLLEMSNADFKGNISYYQMAKLQMEISNKLISTNKELLEEALRLVGN